jgi:hypothetical protein
MNRKRFAALGFAAFLIAAQASRADEFDRIEGDVLARIVQGEGVQSHATLSLKELDSLPAVLRDTRASFLVVKTGKGNTTRLLATPALRKSEDLEGKPVPVLILERVDTFEPGRAGSRLAKGSGTILFDGFQVDFDSGQIAPPGQGGDLEFLSEGTIGPVLKALGKSAIITVSKPIAVAPAAAGPSAGKAVLPGDFNGRYRLTADGRWSGLLELQVGADREISGRFRSEPNGTSYPVAGQVVPETPQKAHFTIKFPRSEQQYDAFLMTEGKNALAGTFTMLDRTFGFLAIREGARVSPLE